MIKYKKFYSAKCPPCKRLDLELNDFWIKDVNIESVNTDEVKDTDIKIVPFIIKYKDNVEVNRFHGSFLIADIIKDNISKMDLQNIHKTLSKARYMYYEQHTSIMSDYEYDMLEKKYDKFCDVYEVPMNKRVTNFVGFDIGILRIIFDEFYT